MIRRILPLGGILAGLLALAPAAHAAANFGSCTLDGNATLTPGLSSNQPTPDPSGPGIDWGPSFTYSFSGTLSNCVKLDGGGPGQAQGGTISAGLPLKINGIDYLPIDSPTGKGGCTGSHTDGVSIIQWADGTLSAVNYSTDGAAAAIGLQGSFMNAIQLTRKDRDANGNIVKDTFSGLRYGGDYTGGPLVFHPMDPNNCIAEAGGTGVKSAPITGTIAHGNYQ